VEAKNQAEGLVHTTERTLKEAGDKVPAGEREATEAAIRDVKAAIDGGDAEAIKAKTQVLGQVSMKIGEAMYKAAAAGPQPGGETGAGHGQPGAGGNEKVVDADFEEVDEKKRGSA
jgi:molecular chaperone DnaK